MSRELSFKISYEKGEVEYVLSLVQEYLEKEANYKVELNMKDVRFSKPRELLNVDPLLDTEMDFKITKSGYKGPRFTKVRFKRDVLTKSFAKVVDMGSGVFDILPEDRGFDDIENKDYTEVFKGHLTRDTALIIEAIEKVHYLDGKYRIYFKDESIFNSDKFNVTCKAPVTPAPTPTPVDPVDPNPVNPTPVEQDDMVVLGAETFQIPDSEAGKYPYPFKLGGLYRLRFEVYNYTKGIHQYIFSDKVYQSTPDGIYDYIPNTQTSFVNNELVVTYSPNFNVTDYITPTPKVIKVNADISLDGEVYTMAELDNGEVVEGPVYNTLNGIPEGSFNTSIIVKHFPDGDTNFVSRYFIPLNDYWVQHSNGYVFYNPQAERMLYINGAYAGDKYVYRLAVPRSDIYQWENFSTYNWTATAMFYSDVFVFDKAMTTEELMEYISVSVINNELVFEYDDFLVPFVIPEEYKDMYSVDVKVFRVRLDDKGVDYSDEYVYRHEHVIYNKFNTTYPWMDGIQYMGHLFTIGNPIDEKTHKDLFSVVVNPDGTLLVEPTVDLQILSFKEMDSYSDDIEVFRYTVGK